MTIFHNFTSGGKGVDNQGENVSYTVMHVHVE